ncbi:MAG TPA: glycosyltransferase family 1 protein [Candidatus Eremiobacteraceae bacterium]|nr:glycosyltransferase family 1 protein [Candidatus Eremiobacteraceae bacterium]
MSVPVIGIDARMTRQMSVGMKIYVAEVVGRLPRVAPDLRFIAFTNAALQTHPDMGVVRLTERESANASWGEQFTLPRAIGRIRPAMVHYCTPYAPRFSPYPYVYTIHDLIHLRFPAYHSWKIPFYYGLLVGPVARGAQGVFVPTRTTADDVKTLLHVDEQRTHVVPLGVAEPFRLSETDRLAAGAAARQRFGLLKPYLLYAGNHRPHKNLKTLFEAWQRAAVPCDLVVTEDGPFGFDAGTVARQDRRLVQLGHVAVRDLIGLYAGCAAAVQPSLYEGFGLAAAEAMAAGAPCIVAETPALLEVVGVAALTFPPRDADALSRAIEKMLGDAAEAARRRESGRRRAASFAWDDAVRAIAGVYRQAIASSSPPVSGHG